MGASRYIHSAIHFKLSPHCSGRSFTFAASIECYAFDFDLGPARPSTPGGGGGYAAQEVISVHASSPCRGIPRKLQKKNRTRAPGEPHPPGILNTAQLLAIIPNFRIMHKPELNRVHPGKCDYMSCCQ
jgi:hypothetical protein